MLRAVCQTNTTLDAVSLRDFELYVQGSAEVVQESAEVRHSVSHEP
jgi:hypothetical protein